MIVSFPLSLPYVKDKRLWKGCWTKASKLFDANSCSILVTQMDSLVACTNLTSVCVCFYFSQLRRCQNSLQMYTHQWKLELKEHHLSQRLEHHVAVEKADLELVYLQIPLMFFFENTYFWFHIFSLLLSSFDGNRHNTPIVDKFDMHLQLQHCIIFWWESLKGKNVQLSACYF